MIRPVRPDEYDAVSKLCVDAYLAAGTVQPGDPYLPFLRDTAARASEPAAEVLVLTDGDDIVGSVTLCPYGSVLTQVCGPGEVEPRVLAVAPEHARQGVAARLITATEDWARDHGLQTVTVCVAEHNVIGHNLYRKLGFVRRPERDWVANEGVTLQTYTRAVAGSPTVFCPRCGGELNNRDHAACQQALGLEPPRYCAACKRRMVVQITPTGWTARCKEHGQLSS